MCGFVGYLLTPAQLAPGLAPDLGTWSDLIAHRGPDQSGTGTSGPFGVSTCRLSILDLSEAGAQPMQTGRYLMGYNGEVYNHQDIRAELAGEGVGPGHFRGNSDTETILMAIEHWGIGPALERLNGIYALAVWDRQENELTLARDPMGVKPLYVMQDERGVHFGSELKALKPLAGAKLDRESLALYFYFGFVPSPYTLIRGVRKLQPGQVLRFSGPLAAPVSSNVLPRAWNVPLDPGLSPAQQVRQSVEAACERQLLSDVPVGIALSGGIDSTIVAAVAATRVPGAASFSIRPAQVPGQAAGDDARLAAVTARRLGFSHHEIEVRPGDLLSEPGVMSMLDEPVNEPYVLAEILLSRATGRAGVPVLLTGHAADELFLGYESYDSLMRWQRNNTLPLLGPALNVASRLPVFAPERRQGYALAARGWRRPVTEWYGMSTSAFSESEAAALTGVAPERVTQLVQGILGAASEAAGRLPGGRELHPLEHYARLDLMLNVTDHYNPRLDRASMSQSVEARVPFEDLDVVNTAMRLPHDTLLQGGLKGLLKEAFHDLLPAEIRDRPKQKFQAPVASWMDQALSGWATGNLTRAGSWMDLSPLAAPATPFRGASRRWSVALVEAWRGELGLEG